MPIYEYECQACGDVQEVMQKISDPAPEACPVCAKGPMQKIMSRTAFVLKGEGWYVTDFRDNKKKKPAEGDAKSDAKTESKSETKSEAKSETKSETKSDSSSSSTPAPASSSGSGS